MTNKANRKFHELLGQKCIIEEQLRGASVWQDLSYTTALRIIEHDSEELQHVKAQVHKIAKGNQLLLIQVQIGGLFDRREYSVVEVQLEDCRTEITTTWLSDTTIKFHIGGAGIQLGSGYAPITKLEITMKSADIEKVPEGIKQLTLTPVVQHTSTITKPIVQTSN